MNDFTFPQDIDALKEQLRRDFANSLPDDDALYDNEPVTHTAMGTIDDATDEVYAEDDIDETESDQGEPEPVEDTQEEPESETDSEPTEEELKAEAQRLHIEYARYLMDVFGCLRKDEKTFEHC